MVTSIFKTEACGRRVEPQLKELPIEYDDYDYEQEDSFLDYSVMEHDILVDLQDEALNSISSTDRNRNGGDVHNYC